MYYSYQKKLYTKEQIEGMTFSEDDKPEPLFTLNEMLYAIVWADTQAERNNKNVIQEYFKEQFNLSI